MKVMIVGAGIGGICAALSLRKAGIDAKLFDAKWHPESSPMGIMLNPASARELSRLGLKPSIDAVAIRPTATRYYTAKGLLIYIDPCGTHAGYQWPHWSLRRSDLYSLLTQAYSQVSAPQDRVLGAQLQHFTQTTHKVTAHFVDSETGELRTEESDLLIGADGLHSVVRKNMFPREPLPRYSGMMAYRGRALVNGFLDAQSIAIIGDKRQRILCCPISKHELNSKQGKSLVDWIAYLPRKEPRINPDKVGETEAFTLSEHFRDWHFHWLDVAKLIRASKEIVAQPLFDRDPHRQWTFGRVTLLGDAAHPLLPMSTNGASLAILDAAALAHAVASAPNPQAGLIRYEELRLALTNRIVEANRASGAEVILELALNQCPLDSEFIHDHLAYSTIREALTNYKNLTKTSPEAVNEAS